MGEWGRRGHSSEKRIERFAKALGLTQEQKDQYIKESNKMKDEARNLNAKNKELFGIVEKELLKDSPDKGLIANSIEQIGKNRTKIQISRMNQIIELRKNLTPEQKEKLEKMMSSKKDRNPIKLENRRQKNRDK